MHLVVRRRVPIARPAADVFRYVADFETYPRYFPGIQHVRAEDDLPPATVGKRYSEVAHVPLLGSRPVTIEVVEAVPGKSITTEADLAPLYPRLEIEVIPESSCRSLLDWSFLVRNDATWFRLALLPLTRLVLAGRSARAMQRLQQILEA